MIGPIFLLALFRFIRLLGSGHPAVILENVAERPTDSP
jgi:hypothetical protein